MSHIYISFKGIVDNVNKPVDSTDVERMGFSTIDICVLDKDTVKEFMMNDPDLCSEMMNHFNIFYKCIVGNGIKIRIGNNNMHGYNKYVDARGFPGIAGDILMFAETINDEDLEVGIDTHMAIMLTESILEKRGMSLIDCFIHASRKKENMRIKLNKYVHMTKKSNKYTEEVLQEVVSNGNTIYSPDDSSDIVCCEITCSMCGSCKPTEKVFVDCDCERATYCSEECKSKGWRSHSKHVHKGKMTHTDT